MSFGPMTDLQAIFVSHKSSWPEMHGHLQNHVPFKAVSHRTHLATS